MGVFTEAAEFWSSDWLTCKLKAILTDMDDCGPTPGAWKITAIDPTANPTVTTQAAHGISAGEYIEIFGVTGSYGANGLWQVATVPSATTFTFIKGSPPGVYLAGGHVAVLSKSFLSEFAPSIARVATLTIPQSGRAVANGYCYAPQLVFTDITGDTCEALLVVRAADNAVDSDLSDTEQRILAIKTIRETGASGFPVTPPGVGHTVTISWNTTYGVLGV